jgi:hypothetical protein
MQDLEEGQEEEDDRSVNESSEEEEIEVHIRYYSYLATRCSHILHCRSTPVTLLQHSRNFVFIF